MGKMKRLTGWDYIAGVKVGDTLVGVHDQQAFHRLALIEDILGDEYDLEELRDMVLAKREGRVAIFPCKPSGVTVYQLRSKKHALGRGVHPRHISCATVWNGHYQLEHQGDTPCRQEDFGKTWFLDEQSATVALEKKI